MLLQRRCSLANEEHLAILRRGAWFWNEWRLENPTVRPDFVGANLSYTELAHANLKLADLRDADLAHADLRKSVLHGAYLVGTSLNGAVLKLADLRNATLEFASLIGADLAGVDLTNANLGETSFRNALISGTSFIGAHLENTHLADIDLSDAVGIETVVHHYPSMISTSTLELTARGLAKNPSRQGAVETFLRGAGVPEVIIHTFQGMIGKPVEFYSVFISYSHEEADKRFARRLYNDLQAKGIRCWLDEHEIEPGEPIMKAIDRGIRLWDKVLLCCSETSLNSWWVKDEIKKAIRKERDLEKERGKEVYSLIPLNLDGYLLSDEYRSELDSVLKERLAPNFVGWESDAAKYERELERVVKALRTEREEPPAGKL
jgi:nucleotide-binding universal stress UspA family protein